MQKSDKIHEKINNDYKSLEEKINIKFKNKKLLAQAFCHRSYLNENPDIDLENNERLEFLGDAILELVVTLELFKRYNYSEGKLTLIRAYLVNTKNLANVAKKLSLNNYLLLSKGEAKDTSKAKQYIFANTVEALIGAIYLDKGFGAAKKFIKKYIIGKLQDEISEDFYKDHKSKLQEKTQEKLKITPVYKVLKEEGPDHAKTFLVGVYFNDKLIARGEGTSKQEAEENAAENALILKGWCQNNNK